MRGKSNKMCSHEENRYKVCATCGQKIKFGNENPDRFRVTEKIKSLIQEYVNENYSDLDNRFPLSICNTCRLSLQQNETKVNRKIYFPTMPNYEDLKLNKTTRTESDKICNCYICITARLKTHKKTQKGRVHVQNKINIDENNGLLANKVSDLSRKSLNICKNNRDVLKYCKKYFQEKRKGVQHNCKNSTKTIENAVAFINQLPSKNKEKVLSTCLRQNFEGSTSTKNLKLSLSNQRGKNTSIILNPVEEKRVTFEEEHVDNFLVNNNLSVRKTRKLCNFIRGHVGRHSIPKNYESHITEKNNTLKDIYKTDIKEFEVDSSGKKEKRPVIYADASEILERIIDMRNIIGYYAVKVMADGGQDFFKVCFSVFPEDYLSENEDDESLEDCEDSEDLEPLKKKRKLSNEKDCADEKAKLGSVKRLIMLCIVPKIKETYANIQTLFKLINLNDIPFKFVGDLKLLLIINGQQTASSTFPCPYCFIQLSDFKKCGEHFLLTITVAEN